MFATVFREVAARALLLPRRLPGQRTPLWQQRQRSADLLGAAGRHPDFPMLLEATRECLRDVFDVPALREVMADLRARKTRLVTVETDKLRKTRIVQAGSGFLSQHSKELLMGLGASQRVLKLTVSWKLPAWYSWVPSGVDGVAVVLSFTDAGPW